MYELYWIKYIVVFLRNIYTNNDISVVRLNFGSYGTVCKQAFNDLIWTVLCSMESKLIWWSPQNVSKEFAGTKITIKKFAKTTKNVNFGSKYSHLLI
jgi:hypothetical protein